MKSHYSLIFGILWVILQCCSSKPTSNDVLPPDILVHFNSQDPKDLNVLELSYDNMKHSATLVCLIQGYENSTVNWYLNGDLQEGVYETSDYARANSLKLTGLSENDDGKEYTCREERDGGSVQSVRLLYKNVVSPDILVHFNSEDAKVLDVLELSYDNMKHTATLVCLIEGYELSPVNWYRNGYLQEGVDGTSDYSRANTLMLTGLSENDDGKEYTCKEERDGGSIQKVKLVYKNELALNSPPVDNKNAIEVSILVNGMETSGNELIISRPATLNCLAQGHNPPTLGWFEDNTQLETSTQKGTYSSCSILEISNLPVTERGITFTCRSLHNSNEEISVTVYSVEDKETPTILINDKLVVNEDAILEHQMEVVCTMEKSTAVSSLSLYVDNIPLQYYNVPRHFADGFLRIKTVLQNPKEGQTVSCRAMSDDGVAKVWKQAKLKNYRSNSIIRYGFAALLVIFTILVIMVLIVAAIYCLGNNKRQATHTGTI